MFRLLNERSDAKTVARVLAGHRDEFGELIDRHGGPAFAVARTLVLSPADAEDVVQDAFISAFQKLDSLQQPHRFGAWLITIVRNTALRLRERRLREQPLTAAHETTESPDPHQREIEEIIQSGMNRLEGEQREVLALYYFSGKSVKECAALLDISRDAAAKRLQRARSALGDELITRLGPEARETFALDARKKKAILGAVLAAGASWKASAAAGTAVGVGLGVKVALAGAALLTAGAIAAFNLPEWSGNIDTKTPVDATTVAQEDTATRDDRGDDAGSAASSEVSEEVTVEDNATEGPGRLVVTVKDLDHVVVPGANCVLEKITWGPQEIAPTETLRWTGKSDDAGTVVFENLPLGTYAMAAVSTQLAGVMDYELSADRPERIDSVLELLPYVRDYAGEVLSASGEPVQDAMVYPIEHELYAGQIVDHAQTASIRGHSDAAGAFTVSFIWPGKMRYYVYAEGYAPFISDWQSHQEPARFMLSAGQDVDGVLINEETREPIPGVPIKLALAKRVDHELTTDAEGKFRLPGAAPGEYTVTLDDPALVLSHGRTVTVTPDADELEVEARTGAVIMGRITNAETGDGIPGVEVRAYAGGTSAESVSGPGGEYILLGLGTGTGQISLDDTPGYTHWAGERQRRQNYRNVALEAGEVLDGIDFQMYPAVGVRGIVVDKDGKPVAEAEILVKVDAGSRYAYQDYHDTETDGAGRFQVESLPPGNIVRLLARTDTMASEALYLRDASEQAAEARLVLDRPCTAVVRGSVRGPGGSLLPEASVTFEDEHWFGWKAEMGPDNHFEMAGLPAGIYTLRPIYESGHGFGYGCPNVPTLTVAAGQVIEQHAITCGTGGNLSITGTVYRPDGRTKAGAKVYIPHTPYTTLTDVQGHFELSGLEEKSYQVVASARGLANSEAVQVPADTHGLDLYLREMLTIRGTVTDAATGEPLMATLTARAEGMATQVSSDSDGVFVFDDITENVHALAVQAPGYAPKTAQANFEAGATEAFVDVALEAEAPIAGTVFGADGVPLAGVGIRVGQEYESTRFSNIDGHFTVDGQGAGQAVLLLFGHASYGTTSVMVTPGTPEAENLQVTMAQGPELELRMTLNGTPLTNYNYTLNMMVQTGSIMNAYGSVTPQDGVHVVDDAPAGTMRININTMIDSDSDEGRRVSYNDTVELVNGERTILTHDFRVGSGRIFGALTDDQGNPVTLSGYVGLTTSTEEFDSQGVQLQDGTYSLDGIAAGDYTLALQASADNQVWRTLRVPVSISDGEAKEVDLVVNGANTIAVVMEPGQIIQLYTGDTDRNLIENQTIANNRLVANPIASGPTTAEMNGIVFEDIPDGGYWVVWYSLSAGPQYTVERMEQVDVSGGERAEVVF